MRNNDPRSPSTISVTKSIIVHKISERFFNPAIFLLISNKSDEINQLKQTISELRIQLERIKFEKKEAVQQTKLNSSQEIKDLKLSVSQLRKELENLKFEKQQEVQQTKLSSTDEINQLKSSAQTLRDELEKVIFNYEKQIKKYKK